MFSVLKVASFSFFIPEYFTSGVGEFLVATSRGIEMAVRGWGQRVRGKVERHGLRIFKGEKTKLATELNRTRTLRVLAVC
jgi:hypothetical protein